MLFVVCLFVLLEVTMHLNQFLQNIFLSDDSNICPDAPDSVSLSTIDFTVEDLTDDIQCAVSSIYPGREDTEFRVKVGSQYYTGGTESQSQDSNGVTYTVIYTQSLNFYRNHQGQEVQCEVIWGEGPIEVTKLSNTEKLDVYCKYYKNFTKTIN